MIPLPGRILIIALFMAPLACATAQFPCGLATPEECDAFIARHEAYPGELAPQKAFLKAEIRQGKQGLWIGNDTFRMATGPGKGGTAAPAQQEMLLLLGSIYVEELSKKAGTINYEMSHEAFKMEMRALLNHGTMVKQGMEKGALRYVFQVTTPCLKSLAYANTVACKK